MAAEDSRTFVLRRRARFIVAAAAIGTASAPTIVACSESTVCLSVGVPAPLNDAAADDANDASDSG